MTTRGSCRICGMRGDLSQGPELVGLHQPAFEGVHHDIYTLVIWCSLLRLRYACPVWVIWFHDLRRNIHGDFSIAILSYQKVFYPFVHCILIKCGKDNKSHPICTRNGQNILEAVWVLFRFSTSEITESATRGGKASANAQQAPLCGPGVRWHGWHGAWQGCPVRTMAP